MDSFEDVSARVLLRNVLYTEQPRSPVTRSMSRQQSASSRAKMSTRLRKSDVGLLSPLVALRQKLRQNLHKNISNGSPLKTRKSSLSMSTTIGKVKTPAVTSSHSLSEDDITPRGLLRGILRTEPELSLLVPDRPDSEETEPRSTESSLCSSRPSMGISNMSNLELPDLPTVNLTMAVRGISRKRPKRNINLSVFERKIIDQSGDGSGDGERDATGNLSAMSDASASSLSLSLKTPCAVLHADRRVLQRNAGKRKAISVEDFEAGVHDLLAKKRNPGREQSLSETAGMEKFTLGLSNATASNASSIAMSNTALYPPPVSTPHAYVAIHDRDTVTASQIQREMEAGGGGGVGARTQDEIEEEEMKVEQQQEEEEVGGDAYRGARRKSRRTGSRTGVEEGRAGEQGYEEEAEKMEEDMGAVLDEIDDEGPEGSVREGGDDEAVESEREEEEEERDSVFESNIQEEDGENGTTLESDREEGGAQESTGTQEGGATESEKQEEEVSSGPEQVRVAEHISQRAHRSEGVMKIPGMAGGGRGYKSLSSGPQPMDTGSGEALESTGTQEEGGATESGTQEEEVSSGPEQISQRAYRSEGVMKIPGMSAGRGYKSLSSGLQLMDTGSGDALESTGTQEGGGATESETQEEEVSSVRVGEQISQRAYRSEGVMKIPGMAGGGRGYKSLSSGPQPMDMGSGGALESTGTQEEGGATESETQEEEVSSGPEQISGRAYRSEGVMKIPRMAAGRGYKSLSSGPQPMDTDAGQGSGGAQESTGTQEEGGATESETQEEEVSSGPEHISGRAYRSEGVMKIPRMAAGRGYKSLSSGLQPMDTELESGEGQVEPVMSSEGRASSEWHSGPEEGSLAMGDSPPNSPQAPSPVSSPNEIPPSQEHLHFSRGRSLLEEGEEEDDDDEEDGEKDEEKDDEEDEEKDDEEEENMSGADYAEVPEDKENSIPLAQPVSPEMSLFSPHTPHTSTREEPNAAMRTEGEPEPSEDEGEEEDDLSESEELSLETPAFVRERKRVLTPGPLATPDFLKQMMEARESAQAAAPAAKPKPQRKGRAAPSPKEPGLPKSYVMTTFKHFAKTTVSSECYPILKDVMAKYFDRLADDLEAYATHAKRKTIDVEDVELLMRRQGFVTDSMPVNVLIEKYLPHEYRKLLIPVATSGNKIIPKQKR